MPKNTIIADIKYDITRGSHPNSKVQPLGGYKFTYRDANGELQLIEIKHGLNQHIDREIWDKVEKSKFTQELIDNKVLEVIPEQEKKDQTDELSIYPTLAQIKRVVLSQLNLETLKLWSRGTKQEAVKRFLENHIKNLEGGRVRAV